MRGWTEIRTELKGTLGDDLGGISEDSWAVPLSALLFAPRKENRNPPYFTPSDVLMGIKEVADLTCLAPRI